MTGNCIKYLYIGYTRRSTRSITLSSEAVILIKTREAKIGPFFSYSNDDEIGVKNDWCSERIDGIVSEEFDITNDSSTSDREARSMRS